MYKAKQDRQYIAELENGTKLNKISSTKLNQRHGTKLSKIGST